jgi:hypothetical protein
MTQTITVNPTHASQSPSAAVVRDENEPFSVTDSTGRVFVLKNPDVLAQFDLIEALGELAKNDVYRVMCIPAIYVVSIDGSPAPAPTNKLQMRALISRIGEAGFEAIRAGIKERFPTPKDDEEDEAVKK